MAYQIGIPYVLTSSRGVRACFNDRTDPDFVGFLDPEDGVVGLDSAEIREYSETVAGADGGFTGDIFSGRRPVVLKGSIEAGVPIEIVNERADRLLAIMNDSRRNGDALLRWQESGRPQTVLRLRNNQQPRLQGRLPKTFLLPMVSEYDRIVSYEEHSQEFTISNFAFSGGFSFPMSFPLTFTGVTTGGQYVSNAGNVGAHPRFRIVGPVQNPVITNYDTGESIVVTYSLNDGEYMDIETRPGRRYLKVNGGSSRWGAIEAGQTSWFELQPGNTDLRFSAFSSTVDTRLIVSWRDTW